MACALLPCRAEDMITKPAQIPNLNILRILPYFFIKFGDPFIPQKNNTIIDTNVNDNHRKVVIQTFSSPAD